MEQLDELYKFLEAEAIEKQKRSTLADRIRRFTVNLSDYIGKRRMALDAVYELAVTRVEHDKPIDKSYFTSVVSKEWTIEVDDDGVKWIVLN